MLINLEELKIAEKEAIKFVQQDTSKNNHCKLWLSKSKQLSTEDN